MYIAFIVSQIGRSPLQYAADNGHQQVCDVLIKAGADVHSKDEASIYATLLFVMRITD